MLHACWQIFGVPADYGHILKIAILPVNTSHAEQPGDEFQSELCIWRKKVRFLLELNEISNEGSWIRKAFLWFLCVKNYFFKVMLINKFNKNFIQIYGQSTHFHRCVRKLQSFWKMQSCAAPDHSDRQVGIMDPPSFAEGKKQLLLVFPGLLV